MRAGFNLLPASLQRPLLRHYLVREVCAGRRLNEAELFYLPHVVKPGDVVWDIGANIGEYTFQLSRAVGPTGAVYAFEPLSYNFGTLLGTVKRAKLTNVIPHRLAISDSPGTGRMSALSTLDHSMARFREQGELVAVASIDGLIASGIPVPSFIKCDVEGNGPKVVQGAAKLIRESHPIWLLEVWSDDEITHLESLGYTCYRYPNPSAVLHQVHKREGTTSTYFFIRRTE